MAPLLIKKSGGGHTASASRETSTSAEADAALVAMIQNLSENRVQPLSQICSTCASRQHSPDLYMYPLGICVGIWGGGGGGKFLTIIACSLCLC